MSQPKDNASYYSEGTIKTNNDGYKWVNKYNDITSVMEWIPFNEVQLNGYKALTIDYIRENIGKEIYIYERDSKYAKWPNMIDSNLYKLVWTPNGDAMDMSNGLIINNWLIHQKPDIEDNTVFLLFGFGNGHSYESNNCQFEMALQVNKKNKTLSSNIQSLDAFIHI